MEGAKRNPDDKLNTIGIATVGAVGSALVYLSIVGLQAFYAGETAIVDEIAQFGDQEKVRNSLKSEQVGKITTDLRRMGWSTADGKPVVSIPIEQAMRLVVRDASTDPANLVPAVGRADKATIQPVFGRPLALPPPPPPPPEPPPEVPPPPDPLFVPEELRRPRAEFEGLEALPAGADGADDAGAALVLDLPPRGVEQAVVALRRLDVRGASCLLVDLGRVAHLGGAQLEALTELLTLSERRGLPIALFNVARPLRQLLRIMELEAHLPPLLAASDAALAVDELRARTTS